MGDRGLNHQAQINVGPTTLDGSFQLHWSFLEELLLDCMRKLTWLVMFDMTVRRRYSL